MQSAQPVSSPPSSRDLAENQDQKRQNARRNPYDLVAPNVGGKNRRKRRRIQVYHIVADQNRTQHFTRILYDL